MRWFPCQEDNEPREKGKGGGKGKNRGKGGPKGKDVAWLVISLMQPPGVSEDVLSWGDRHAAEMVVESAAYCPHDSSIMRIHPFKRKVMFQHVPPPFGIIWQGAS